jgi:hypothetical protein
MTKEVVTLIAALIAALTSIITLGLNTRLAILKEKRMILWENELNRLLKLEELVGVVREIAKSFHVKEEMEKRFQPIHKQLEVAAGEFGRYRDLSKCVRDVAHACAVIVSLKNESDDYREWQENLEAHYKDFIQKCDKITKR